MKVAVIGSGPAGVLAAHAAVSLGADVHIYTSSLDPSMVHGASYLHRAIPDVPMPDPQPIYYERLGTVEGYAQKIYGAGFDPAMTSWGRFRDVELGHSLRDMYAYLFELYRYKMFFRNMRWDAICESCSRYDLVVNTAPLSFLLDSLRYGLYFEASSVWIGNTHLAMGRPGDNVIIYNGMTGDDWYRMSSLFGHHTVEYPSYHVGCVEVRKPTAILGDMPSVPENLLLAGRFGAWDKQQLADDAYFNTLTALR